MDIGAVSGAKADGYTEKKTTRTAAEKFQMGSATKEATTAGDGRTIGLMTIGSQGYIAQYSQNSTPENPIVKVGDYEISVNDVDPENATEIEMFALMSHLDKTGQSHNKGISSFTKMRIYSQLAESKGSENAFMEQLNRSTNEIFHAKKNWMDFAGYAKNLFLSNPQTYGQAVQCDNILSGLREFMERYLNHVA